MKVYQAISSALQARINCYKSVKSCDCNGNLTCSKCSNWNNWYENHTEKIESICKEYMPSGSGFDCGTKFDFEKSNPEKLVFNIGYHHMDENGFYDGWSELTVIVKPSLANDIDIEITGIRRKNKHDSEYFYDEMHHCLTKTVNQLDA